MVSPYPRSFSGQHEQLASQKPVVDHLWSKQIQCRSGLAVVRVLKIEIIVDGPQFGDDRFSFNRGESRIAPEAMSKY